MIAAVTVRALCAVDIPALTGVLARAYASKQDFEVRLNAYLRMRSVATFVAEAGGEPVGMVVGNDYGSMAYVSQMAVEPSLQRRGIGSVLMDGLVAWADDRGFAGIELDATPAGAPLYAHYGFAEADQTVVYEAVMPGVDPSATQRHVGASARPYTVGDRAALFAADYRAFGADRTDVLRLLIDSPQNIVVVTGRHGAIDGFAIAQSRANLLGPVVAPNAGAAGCLIDAARTHLNAPHRMSVPKENRFVQAIVAARGYRVSRSLAHLVRGARPRAARHEIFARINLGQG